MTAVAIENRDAFTEPLPARNTFARLEELFLDHRHETVLAKRYQWQLNVFDERNPEPEAQFSDRRNALVNQLTQSELRRAEIELEIIAVARLLVAESDNSEMLTT